MNDDDSGRRAGSFAPSRQRPDDTSELPAGALARLLEVEQDILLRIERAREESERSAAEARAEADLARARLGEELIEAQRELRLRVESEHELELSRIRERAKIEAAKLESCDEARMATLASSFVDLLLVERER